MILEEANRFLHESTDNLMAISNAFSDKKEDFFFFESYAREIENE